jgi:hypothetical protein
LNLKAKQTIGVLQQVEFSVQIQAQQSSWVTERHTMNAYEVHNPSFNDMNLEKQIEHGINDWAVEGKSGHLYFGRTASEAVAIARSFDFK